VPAPLPPAKPRLIGLDLDGTILDARGELGDSMLAALTACRRAGIELAFLTGRRPLTARMGLERYLDRAYVCTNSGCLLWSYPDWQSVAEPRLFPRELLHEICEELAPHSLNLYHEAGPEGAGRVLFKRQCTPETEHGMLLYGSGNRTVTTLEELESVENITQVALPCDAELAYELRDRVRQRFGDRLVALAVRWPMVPCTALELFHPAANKGSALEHFAGLHGFAREEVLAGGDDSNDIAMLQWAGWAVAMPHAQAEVRDVCDAVLESDDGQAALAEYLQAIAAMS
jgi:5-amino-6-(5-phospho-D-ribitylamino)uracil phosphatase